MKILVCLILYWADFTASCSLLSCEFIDKAGKFGSQVAVFTGIQGNVVELPRTDIYPRPHA